MQGKSRKDLSSDSEDEKRRRRRDEKKKGKSGYKNRHRFVVKIDLRSWLDSVQLVAEFLRDALMEQQITSKKSFQL